MERFNEVLHLSWGDTPELEDRLAFNWCEGQVKGMLESKWVEWAKQRLSINFLLEHEGKSMTQYYVNSGARGEVSYEAFVRCIAGACADFCKANGVKPDAASKQFQQKMGY